MKNIFVLILVSISLIYSRQDDPLCHSCIEIVHTGPSSTKYFRPLIISNQQIAIQLTKPEKNFLLQMQKTDTITEQGYLEMLYDIVVTNNETYSLLVNFINNTQEYYANDVNLNPEDSTENFTIFINGKRYDLYWKYKYVFMSKLADYLTLKNGDKKVIKKITKFK